MKIFRSVFTICIFVLAGCASVPVEEAKAVLGRSAACCKAFAEMRFEKVERNTRHKFDLDQSSQIFDFQQGKSFFQAFTLPERSASIIIQSRDGGPLWKLSYVDPLLVFLDSEKKQLIAVAGVPIKRDYHSMVPGFFDWYFGATLPVPAGARYVVIASDPVSTRTQTAYSDGGAAWPANPSPIGPMAILVK